MSSISRFINFRYCWIDTVHSSYILHKKLNKILQEPDWSFLSFWNLKLLYFTCCHSYSFVVPLPVICCDLLSFVVTCCHSLSLGIIRFYSLSLVTLVVIRCTTRCHSLSLVAIRCNSLYHSLSLNVPLICLFINGPQKLTESYKSCNINQSET